jgi:hypothetical protein
MRDLITLRGDAVRRIGKCLLVVRTKFNRATETPTASAALRWLGRYPAFTIRWFLHL